ncbi:hypothetical protein HNR44_000765 [Geomicrobium halophilum]|uniref:Uncharacterized protein n=1 Tax=Geomicrobium halophilum TaxID=549000 RepID=A0A841PNN1_9BACL|nr:hypothetical protein [Geomicrobium halophilum]MBB6448816.1 hypothetical protein [Geomicrobium halophilum]
MKRAFFSIMTALVLFLTGVLSGHYYAYHQWGQIYQEEQESVSPQTEQEAETEVDIVEDDLIERQENVRESGEQNFFSQLGQTLGGSPR